ncbi:MAG: cinnamycin family lantibiotic [Hormoscilla sp. GM7CHS1pb]|nr:cinnamycin family lantibiotic [Hormoscilla sp. GM7CHS1pb]
MSAATLEKLMHQASIDAEFRNELKKRPEVFGLSATTTLPEAIEKQDESFVELLNDALSGLNVVGQCKNTCSFGPITAVCDGTTKYVVARANTDSYESA